MTAWNEVAEIAAEIVLQRVNESNLSGSSEDAVKKPVWFHHPPLRCLSGDQDRNYCRMVFISSEARLAHYNFFHCTPLPDPFLDLVCRANRPKQDAAKDMISQVTCKYNTQYLLLIY